ncbi:MAG TPA: hypothetical protein VK280_23385 [Streptosporangiaceae bacterium]|nr:hypothetical protein [Streptosporangiaceae bacterium]
MSYPSQGFSTTPPRRLSDTELQRRMIEAFPESTGPGTDHESGAVSYGQPGHPRVGKIEPLLPPEVMWRERAEQEAAQAAIPAEIRAARQMIEDELRLGRRF